MKRVLFCAVSILAVTALATGASAAEQKAKVQQVAGEITAVDAKAKTITIRTADRDVTLDASRIKDVGKMKVGDKVTAEYTEKDGKLAARAVKAAGKPAAPAYK